MADCSQKGCSATTKLPHKVLSWQIITNSTLNILKFDFTKFSNFEFTKNYNPILPATIHQTFIHNIKF